MRTSNPLVSLLLATGTCLSLIGTLPAAVVMVDESSSGDFSDLGPTPTDIGTLMIGTNTATGTMGGTPIDRDIFTFQIPVGSQLTLIELTSFAVTSGSVGSGSFITAGTGATSGAPTVAGSFGHVITATPGSLFAASLPAGPGDYNVWIQETAGGVVDYTLSFTVVPEPSTLALGAFAFAALIGRRRR